LAHPNLLRLKGFCLEPPCIVTELIEGGSLLDFLNDPTKNVLLDWRLRLKIANDIAKGCAFLHSTSPPILHRDLKSPNILLVDLSPSASVVAKVCDFGVSISALGTTPLARKVDCPFWLAPEIMENKSFTEKADVYSVGVIFWELLTKQQIFSEVKFLSLIEKLVLEGKRPDIPGDCIPSYQHLIEQCWAQKPEDRPSFSQVVLMIQKIIEGVCPEIAQYDATADSELKAKLEKEQMKKNEISINPKGNDKPFRRWSSTRVLSARSHAMFNMAIQEWGDFVSSKQDIILFMQKFADLQAESDQTLPEEEAEEAKEEEEPSQVRLSKRGNRKKSIVLDKPRACSLAAMPSTSTHSSKSAPAQSSKFQWLAASPRQLKRVKNSSALD